MHKAYTVATDEVASSLIHGGAVLDCGAGRGRMFDVLNKRVELDQSNYFGVEWSSDAVDAGNKRGLNISCANLNNGLPFQDDKFSCVFALSVLEHLLNGCKFLRDCHRVLRENGTLVLLTPNISTYFTAALILLGKMPSSGPHPDSEELVGREVLFKVSSEGVRTDVEAETPMHRHLVVFSYRVLRDYLHALGFSDVRGYGFGLYPFPNCVQPFLERVDPYHCHQMVFVARK